MDAYQQPPPQGYPQPGYPQPGYPQPGYAQPYPGQPVAYPPQQVVHTNVVTVNQPMLGQGGYQEQEVMCCGCIPMRCGMIILFILDIFGLLFLGLILTAMMALASNGYGDESSGYLGAIIPAFCFAFISWILIGSFLCGEDTSMSRRRLITAMWFSIVSRVILMCVMTQAVKAMAVDAANIDNNDQQVEVQVQSNVGGDILGLLFNIWYLISAKQFYVEKLKAEGKISA